ncbi:hypothetical protein KP509_37G053800 [Ceratopteris richardii]|uniref:Uncharacterized protein n=1 Tax=Ceratopteris richardii TaxID=49495 RepID=A0A8T2Q7Y1_CERRI|nr:hypothetical protein KP509_37G053800 [Ceratopteris richardii]
MEEQEEAINNDVFASLMPNLFSRLQHCDGTVSEQEFQEIHRLLDKAISIHDEIKVDAKASQHSNGKPEDSVLKISNLTRHEEHVVEEGKRMPSPRSTLNNVGGKENFLPDNFPQRNKVSRRERSSRMTTHKKPFTVDISFGSILNNNGLGRCEKPQDVHAFWEAADEHEASEAIMGKLRGKCEQKAPNEMAYFRRFGVRRKNSQRRTTRLKRFAVELPSSVEQVQSLDQEQLEEEEDVAESSLTFLSNPEFKFLDEKLMQNLMEKDSQGLQQLSNLQKSMESTHLDGMSLQLEELDTLSDAKSPLINALDVIKLTGGTASNDEASESSKHYQMEADDAIPVEDPLKCLVAFNQPSKIAESNEVACGPQMKATPFDTKTASRNTPFTSPTPPSNPLALFRLAMETTVEDLSKRRLDFGDTTEPQTLGLELLAPETENMCCSQILQTSPVSTTTINPQILQTSPISTTTMNEEGTVTLVEELTAEALRPAQAPNSSEKVSIKPLQKAITRRKKLVENRRYSLEGAGTSWEQGQRRSTRIKSRPLEWWRGERFLHGRVHKSLVTVIGIKYSSPVACWSKRGSTKAPNFKVESYVSEEYAKYVQFAARG